MRRSSADREEARSISDIGFVPGVELVEKTFFFWNCAREYGGAVTCFASPQSILIDSTIFEINLAGKTLAMNAGGFVLSASSSLSLTVTNSIFFQQSSHGIGGGVTLAGIQPNTVINFEHSWFLGCHGISTQLFPPMGGNIVLGPLANATNVSVTFNTCRFNATHSEGRGRDIFCFAGWSTVITPTSFPCSVAMNTNHSIYVDGVTGDQDDFWLALSTPDKCPAIAAKPKIPKHPPKFEFSINPSLLTSILCWAILILLNTVIVMCCGCLREGKCSYSAGCRFAFKCWRGCLICLFFPLYLIYYPFKIRMEKMKNDTYIGWKMNTRKKVRDTAFKSVLFRKFDIAGFLVNVTNSAREDVSMPRPTPTDSAFRRMVADASNPTERTPLLINAETENQQSEGADLVNPCKQAEAEMFRMNAVSVFCSITVEKTRERCVKLLSLYE
ncbi:hypothetical protein BLNAU_14558 [Blattamonas nauphoetae]|uniref:Uncharacterized protein n=1 Tax=Blattamonas nauphoetae TaxID=2049346 RepID=A0ABQ9XGL9_9EUKA|nr:hypothetical protein BLNAU_14558 [Blattamonas nauphoetae]